MSWKYPTLTTWHALVTYACHLKPEERLEESQGSRQSSWPFPVPCRTPAAATALQRRWRGERGSLASAWGPPGLLLIFIHQLPNSRPRRHIILNGHSSHCYLSGTEKMSRQQEPGRGTLQMNEGVKLIRFFGGFPSDVWWWFLKPNSTQFGGFSHHSFQEGRSLDHSHSRFKSDPGPKQVWVIF